MLTISEGFAVSMAAILGREVLDSSINQALQNKMAEDSLQRVRNWFWQSKLGEYPDLFISNGFDSLELIFECVDKQLLEEQFAEGICLPGKWQQLLLAIWQQKESKPPRQTEMSMYDWFQENDISSHFNAFINKGYDDLEVVIETITEDVLSV